MKYRENPGREDFSRIRAENQIGHADSLSTRLSPDVCGFYRAHVSTDPRPSDEGLLRLGAAIAALDGDGDYIAAALTEFLHSRRPVAKDLMRDQRPASDSATGQELGTILGAVEKGSLQVGAAEAFLAHLATTLSLEDTAAFLGWDEDRVRASVSENRLYAVEFSGRLRFPSWQFALTQPDKLLPGLANLIQVLTRRWGWASIAGFMSTPQADLVSTGRQTPTEWLLRGGSVDKVVDIVETSDLW